ncbi:MAG: PEP-CTERM sorting domain-containing protein [Aquabacterium sp.]
MRTCKPRLAFSYIAAAAATICALTAHAAVTPTGSYGVGPNFVILGPGDTILPDRGAWIGTGSGAGSLTVDGGSFLQLARLSFGSGGVGAGTGLISGPGTRVELVGDGASNSQVQRLIVGDWGGGQLTVNQGALLDTRGNQAPCLLAFHYCDSFVGGAAGDSAVLNIDGSGSAARFGQNLFVAAPGLAIQHLDGHTYGVPGGTTRGTVNVTNGALLSTMRAQIAPRHWSTNATGREKNIGEVHVDGAGSRWLVTGGLAVDNSNGNVFEPGANILTGNDRNSWATINVTNGAVIEVQGGPTNYNAINLTNGGGRTDMLVSGAGSRVAFTGPNGVLQVGRRLGSANMQVLDGGLVEGLYYLSVGREGSFGDLLVDGPGSRISVSQFAVEALQGTSRAPAVNIGRSGGTGMMTVRNGGVLEVIGGAETSSNSPHITIGVDAASAGTLKIQGPGSRVELRSSSLVPGGGAGEASNPFMSVGYDGRGTLEVSGGAQLLLQGNAVSTQAHQRGTTLYIGGRHTDNPGGHGVATVTGAGSAIRVLGADAFIGVGSGANASGQLDIRDGALVEATIMNVGRNAVGVLEMNNATLRMSGQYTGGNSNGNNFGAALSIGNRGGVGVAKVDNGSFISIVNMGSSGATINLGGTGVNPLGDGSMTISGGSRVEVVAQAGLGTVSVGRDGSGFMRVRGASTLDVSGGNLYIGRVSGGDGTMVVSEGSTVNAGFVGVGRTGNAQSNSDGGTGTFVLINSTLNAQDIVIGTNGFLGGSGTINGNVTNWGIFSPGNSPGTVQINGDYSAQAGSRLILEVQDNGQGGFLTDVVLFGDGHAVNLAGLVVEFRFLGITDPNAFLNSGAFNIDTFLGVAGVGGETELADTAFDAVRFTARADAYQFQSFSYTAGGGADFIAVAVPEPQTYALLAAGLAVVAQMARRRRRAA